METIKQLPICLPPPSIFVTAYLARWQLQHGMVDHALLVQLYRQYAGLEDAEKFVEAAKVLFPSHCCGLASCYLLYSYGCGHIIHERVCGRLHTRYQHPTGWRIDITADQFGGPPILLLPPTVYYQS